MRITRNLAVALCLLPLVACASTAPSGRIKAAGEAVGVDRSRGGTAVYDELAADTMTKLLDRHRKQINVQNPGGFLCAFIQIDTLGAEELRDHKPALYDRIQESFVNSGLYRMMSMRMVDAARAEAGITQPDDLFLEKYRTAFMEAVGKNGLSPDYLIWGKMTTQSSQITGNVRERRYRMSVEMIDAETGIIVAQESGERIKEYTN